MVSEFPRRYISHIHVRSLAVLFKSVDDEMMSQLPRGLRMDVQDRMAALDEPSSSQVLAASHHIFPVVFTKSFNLDIENVVFAVSADVGSAL